MLKNNKIAFLIFFLSFLFTSASCIAPSTAITRTPNKAFVKVFHTIKIDCKDPKNKKCPGGNWRSMGSGIIIDLQNPKITETIILTAGHVCESILNAKLSILVKSQKQEVFVQFYDGLMHKAEVILHTHPNPEQKNGDLCALKVSGFKKSCPKVKISKNAPTIGEDLISMAAPGGVYHPPMVPIFKGIYSGAVDEVTSITTIPAKGGASGAGVLNKNFELVGILFAVSSRSDHISLVVRHNILKEFTMEVTGYLLLQTSP